MILLTRMCSMHFGASIISWRGGDSIIKSASGV